MDPQQQIGQRIREARLRAGLSQVAAADALGIARPTLTSIEAGRRSVRAEELVRFAAVLRASVYELLSDRPIDGVA